MHTAGEPIRIFDGRALPLGQGSILDKRREMQRQFDRLRRSLMLEPRGHADMYGAILVEPSRAGFDAAALFCHASGYSTMCGHATLGLGRLLYDQSVANGAPRRQFQLECPCGPVTIDVEPSAGDAAPLVSFCSVESFALALDQTCRVEPFGELRFDLGYGGAFYAILTASSAGLSLTDTPLEDLHRFASALVQELRRTRSFKHPQEADLSFLYGAILTDDTPLGASGTSTNLCWFGEGQIDRSPTGSGVSARLAVAHARGALKPQIPCSIAGASGLPFTGTIAEVTSSGVHVRVAGRSHYMGESTLIVEPDDPLGEGFVVARTMRDVASSRL